ncbi:MAG: alcohol dehydrogenase catalytic domain-containing protein [Nitrospiraceae bacterium]|nr:MAG: alcohol dehydrogenase catalytic domain-containing protein [Nitrospiraceae bacterium]
MRALIFDGELRYVTDYPFPKSRDGEALIRVTCAGICNTDREIIKGYMDFRGVLGHEFAGVVEECGRGDMIGRPVVGEINIGCGTCSFCRSGMRRHCPARSVLGIAGRDGVFAEYTALPLVNLHVIPDTVSPIDAVFVEPVAAAYEIMEQVSITPMTRVCVLGDGKLGLLAAQAIARTGCHITASGRHREKLSILEDAGIDTRINPEFREREFDVVVDCTGSPDGIRTALQAVKPAGTIVLKTTVASPCQIDLNQIVIDEISLIGSRCGPFDTAIRALEAGEINTERLVSGVYPLEDGLMAFDHAARKDALKVILKAS